MSRYDLTDFEWRVIEPLLPNKPRGVPRVDDRRVLNGIFWVLRSGAPWRYPPKRYGSHTTCYNRFLRSRPAGSPSFEGSGGLVYESTKRGRRAIPEPGKMFLLAPLNGFALKQVPRSLGLTTELNW